LDNHLNKSHFVSDDKILELPAEQIRPDDIAIVPQGEMIPVDGEIAEGASSIDESVGTGEPFAVSKKAGDWVTSGAISLTSQLKIRAAKPGDKEFLYVMAKKIAESLKCKPKIHRRADGIVQFSSPEWSCTQWAYFSSPAVWPEIIPPVSSC
jgi:Cu+-exporting ATPase